jgi:hypothetical protein
MENTTITSTESLTSGASRFTAHQLSTDAGWASRAISILYTFQTADEQEAQTTAVRNGAGFNGTDAFILSSFAVQIGKGRTLSAKQLAIAFKKLPKYAGQVVASVQPEKLDGFLRRASDWAVAKPQKAKAVKAPAPQPEALEPDDESFDDGERAYELHMHEMSVRMHGEFGSLGND